MSKVKLVAVGLILLAVALIAASQIGYRPLGNPPIRAPPIGGDDQVYSQEGVVLEARTDLGSLNNCIVYHTFETYGRSVCLYGNLTSDRYVRLFLTDDTGFQEVQDTGGTNRFAFNIDDIHSHDWEWILAPYCNGSYVTRWYVVISAFGYSTLEWDRHVNYYICQDLTPPQLEVEVPRESKGLVLLNITASDLHCDLVTVEVKCNDTPILHESGLSSRSFVRSVVWNTSNFIDGTYKISAYVEDAVGNHFTYEWLTSISNAPPEPMWEIKQEEVIRYAALGMSILTLVVVFSKRVDSPWKLLSIILISCIVVYVASSEEFGPLDIIGLMADAIEIAALIVALAKYFTYRRAKKRTSRGLADAG